MSSDKHDDRGRDRGSRDRDRGDRGRPNETNKSDTKSVRCRVFVGNLNTENLSRQEFEEVFSKHGRVIGCSIHNGYGFVQYEKDSGADEAVLKQHGSIIKERRVDVNLAGDRRKPENRDKRPESFQGRGRGRPGGLDRPRDRSPSPGGRGVDDPFGAPGYRGENRHFRDDPHSKDPLDRADRSPLGAPLKQSPYGAHRRPDDLYPRQPDLDELPAKRSKSDYDYPSNLSGELPFNKPGAESPIDCEVIIINKQQRGYADIVEKKLKSHGLVVECAHLPETVTLVDELEDASRRGVLYGIIISSQHEVHYSVTVHILHGTQQEHRNMPLEDAINLVSRNFEMYMQALRERERGREQGREQGPAVSGEAVEAAKGYGGANSLEATSVAAVPYSLEIARLLNMAADGKSLSANQYSQLINEFTKLRDDLLKQEGRTPPVSSGSTSKPFPTDPQSIALQQAELQAKILSILNPTTISKVANDAKGATANSLPVKANSSAVSDAKPAAKIPVLTPSYSSSTAFKAHSSVPSQTASGANTILGMALSTVRGSVAQNATTLQHQTPVMRTTSSAYAPASGISAVRSTQPQVWSQYRVPSIASTTGTIPTTAQSYQYGAPGQYTSNTNTGYRAVLPNSYLRRY